MLGFFKKNRKDEAPKASVQKANPAAPSVGEAAKAAAAKAKETIGSSAVAQALSPTGICNVDKAAWNGTQLTLELSGEDAALPAGALTIRLRGDGQMLGSFHVGREKSGSKAKLFAVIDLERLAHTPAAEFACTASLTLVGAKGDVEPVGVKAKDAARRSFLKQAPRLRTFVALPDVLEGAFAIHLLGINANTERLAPDTLPAKRPFGNAVLLSSLAFGMGTLLAARDHLAAGTLRLESLKEGEAVLASGRKCLSMRLTTADAPGWLDPRLVMARWQNGRLCLELDFNPEAAFLLGQFRPTVVLVDNAAKASRAVEGYLIGSTLLVNVSAEDMEALGAADAVTSLVMEIRYQGPDEATANGRVGINRADGVFAELTRGFSLTEGYLTIPDEREGGGIALRVVGRGAKTAGNGTFKLRQRDEFANRLLLAAGKQGTDALFALAQGLQDGTLATSLDYTQDDAGKVKVTCHCTAGSTGFDLDVTSIPLVKKSTMLSQGETFASLSINRNHEEQFGCLFDMLVEFDELCQKHGIEYYFAYGTLIGAIRHEGFIPWDHDVDLFMTRDNYRKLQQVFAQGLAPAGRTLEDPETNPACQTGFGRYMNVETARFNPIMPRGAAYQGNAGIFMDLFLLAPLEGNDPESIDYQGNEMMALLDARHTYERGATVRYENFYKAKALLDADIASMGREAALQAWHDRLYEKDEASAEYFVVATDSRPWPLIYPREWFGTPRRVNLLGHDFSLPQQHRPQLVAEYGADWRHFPSDTHIPQERDLYNSITVPWDAVKDEVNRGVSQEKFLRHRDQRTDAQYRDNLALRDFHPMLFAMGETVAKQQRDATMQAAGMTLEAAVEAGHWSLISQAIDPYFRTWELAFGRFIDVYYPLESPWFQAAIYAQLCSEQPKAGSDDGKSGASVFLKLTSDNSMHRAWSFIRKRERTGGPLDPIEQETKDTVLAIMAIRDQMEDGDWAAARATVDHVLQILPQSTDALAADLYLRAQEAQGEPEALAPILSRAEELMARYGFEQYTVCAAYANDLLGNADRARLLYAKLLRNSNDGMLLRYCAAAVERLA